MTAVRIEPQPERLYESTPKTVDTNH